MAGKTGKNEAAIPAETLPQFLDLDPETGLLTWKHRDRCHFGSNREFHRWNNRYAGTPAFTALASKGYYRSAIKGYSLAAHRIVWALHYGAWPDGQIDHINGIKTDNRIANLRVVTLQENLQNMPLGSNNKSGVMGVHSRGRKWVASITVSRRRIYLGLFADKEQAGAARKAAEIEMGFHPNHGRPMQ